MFVDTRRSPSTEQGALHVAEISLERLYLALTRGGVPTRRLREYLGACETFVTVNAWESHQRNITRTAAALGVSRRRVRETLSRWRTSRVAVTNPDAE